MPSRGVCPAISKRKYEFDTLQTKSSYKIRSGLREQLTEDPDEVHDAIRVYSCRGNRQLSSSAAYIRDSESCVQELLRVK